MVVTMLIATSGRPSGAGGRASSSNAASRSRSLAGSGHRRSTWCGVTPSMVRATSVLGLDQNVLVEPVDLTGSDLDLDLRGREPRDLVSGDHAGGAAVDRAERDAMEDAFDLGAEHRLDRPELHPLAADDVGARLHEAPGHGIIWSGQVQLWRFSHADPGLHERCHAQSKMRSRCQVPRI